MARCAYWYIKQAVEQRKRDLLGSIERCRMNSFKLHHEPNCVPNCKEATSGRKKRLIALTLLIDKIKPWRGGLDRSNFIGSLFPALAAVRWRIWLRLEFSHLRHSHICDLPIVQLLLKARSRPHYLSGRCQNPSGLIFEKSEHWQFITI